MAKKKWFDKDASLDAGEVILEEVPEAEVVAWSDVQETENSAEREQEPKDEQVEAKVSTVTEPTPTEIKFAKGFKGTPSPVDNASKQLAQSCASTGLLADFGPDDGYARGFKWHLYCK